MQLYRNSTNNFFEDNNTKLHELFNFENRYYNGENVIVYSDG